MCAYLENKGPEFWSAVAAWLFGAIAIAVQIIVQYKSNSRSAVILGIETIHKLDDQFQHGLVEVRQRAAVALQTTHPTAKEIDAIEEVLDFFEVLAYLHRKNIIDTELAWHYFAYCLLPYFYSAESVVRDKQQSDSNVYGELEALYLAVKKFEESKHPSGDSRHLLSPYAVRMFLDQESRLIVSRAAL